MKGLRHPSALLLAAVFAAFQLLATAPVLHTECETVQAVVTAQHQREAPAFRGEPAGLPRSTDECPICMLSGLSVVLSPQLAVSAPGPLETESLPPAETAARSPLCQSLGSRAPPAVS
ncbi:MAG TPA: hypothetical protein VFR03_12865 [Thermoanaerobaculia bacterium]|nr:hypothetical protein [Thermoanaerobaculia bacterium]